MTTRIPFVGGNWKMNLTRRDAQTLVEQVNSALAGRSIECAVYPSFVFVADALAHARGSLRIGAQDCAADSRGAFTGQVSAAMLKDVGCSSVLIGHSERRHGLGESDALVARKLSRALEASLVPVVCVGETLAQREAGDAHRVIESQLVGSLAGHSEESLSTLVIAYEPVWAIGTGRTASPDDAAEAHRTVRRTLEVMYSARFSEAIRVIYGGSVTAKNAAELFAREEIDGGLIGGASLVAADFQQIIEAASARIGR